MLCDIIVDTVNECPEGAPLGVLYLPFMGRNILTLEGFNSIVSFLVFAKKVRKSGDCLYPMDRKQ
jgi:hypothetical protein